MLKIDKSGSFTDLQEAAREGDVDFAGFDELL